MDNYEREIDLRQLLILIAMRWRSIAAIAVVCAVLGGIFQLNAARYRMQFDLDSIDDIEEEDVVETYRYKMQLYKEIRKGFRDEIENHRRLIESQREFLENNVQMAYDAANIFQVLARLEFDERVDVDGLFESFRDAAAADAFWAKSSAKHGIAPKYLRSMLSIRQDTAREMTLTITTGDKGLAEDLLAMAVESVPEKPRRITQIEPYVISSPGIMDFQRTQRGNMLGLVNSLNGVYNSYDRLQKPRKPAIRAWRKPPVRKTGQTGASSPARAFVKGGVLGCMAGAFAICTLMALRLVMAGRVLSPGEFFGKYQYNCLAILPPRPRRRRMRAADKILLRWSDSSRFAKLGEAERFEVAAENIRHRVKEGAPLLLLGTVDARTLDAVRTALSKGLQDNAISTRQFIDQQLPVMHDIDTHEHIVLVEKLYCSKYRDIDNEAQTIAERHKEVVGCILV